MGIERGIPTRLHQADFGATSRSPPNHGQGDSTRSTGRAQASRVPQSASQQQTELPLDIRRQERIDLPLRIDRLSGSSRRAS